MLSVDTMPHGFHPNKFETTITSNKVPTRNEVRSKAYKLAGDGRVLIR